jgi:hypothetical protein
VLVAADVADDAPNPNPIEVVVVAAVGAGADVPPKAKPDVAGAAVGTTAEDGTVSFGGAAVPNLKTIMVIIIAYTH